jgi:hypothetical protein
MAGAGAATPSAPGSWIAQMSAATTQYDRMQDLPDASISARLGNKLYKYIVINADFLEQPRFSEEIPSREFDA